MSGQLVPDGDFDRDLGLAEWLGEGGAALVSLLTELLDAPACLRDEGGMIVAGAACAQAVRVPVRGTLEPIGYLEADAPQVRVQAAAKLVERLYKAELRYRMASSLHLEAVRADYAALKEQHAALQASEGRYRELSEQLERRVAEQVQTLQHAQRQLYQAEKLASVGQLAAGVAHEINTPIGFIRSNLTTARRYRDTLEHYYRETGPAPRKDLEELFSDFSALLDESVQGTERVAHIVSVLKDFSRVDRREVAPVDLNSVIGNAVEMVRPLGMGRIEFMLELAPLPPCTCNAGHLGQVFLNLLTNAVQAIEDRGTVRVRSLLEREQILVAVEDDGRGIAPADLARVFEPFFTTREVGRGSGLGLTLSNDIVRAHGGRIDIASVPGEGTRVAVVLPLTQPEG